MNQVQLNMMLYYITLYQKGAVRTPSYSSRRERLINADKDLPIFKALLAHCQVIDYGYKVQYGVKDDLILADELTREYCASSVSINTLSKIYTGRGVSYMPNSLMGAVAYRLNKRQSFFKSYIKKKYYDCTTYAYLKQQGTFRSSVSEEDADILVDKNDLEFKKKLGVSAHPVTMYKGQNGLSGLYFAKSFEEVEIPRIKILSRIFAPKAKHLNQEKERAVAEVLYAKIWRYLLGEQVSESLLVRENGVINGICSKGLADFIEYFHIINSESMMAESKSVPGLIAITVLAYILMEDDLHVYNIGWTNVDGYRVFGKIDHDFLCTRWENNWVQNELVRKFDLSKALNFVSNPSYDTMKVMMKTMRFSPGTRNNNLLRFGHYARSKVSGKSVNTIGKEDKRYFKYTYVPYHKDELHGIAYKLRRIDIGNFYSTMKGYLSTMGRKGLNTCFAHTILECITRRLERIHKPYAARRMRRI
ncbi:MAG: hypothetical protein GY750_18265 [Lentisphaerae bacterium]|nr:hypothetical protein [Lentisphaerota bacterium]MCP4103342.1 hypothetical protein [Lentisphaerota bacterium]